MTLIVIMIVINKSSYSSLLSVQITSIYLTLNIHGGPQYKDIFIGHVVI